MRVTGALCFIELIASNLLSTSAKGEIGCRKLVFVWIHPTESHKLGILIAIANPFSTCPLLLLDTLRDPKKSLRTH
jgi:hypothetical protein